MKNLVLVALWLPSLAFGQSFAEAEAQYADGNLNAALKLADASLKRSRDPQEVSKLQTLRGVVLFAQGKNDKARAAFVLALKADEGAQLNAQRDPSAVLALFDEARASVPPGTVTVSTTMANAVLRVDGTDFGPLPLTTKLPVGRHALEATGADGRVNREEVLVRSGEAQSVQLNPERVAIVEPPPEPPPLVAVEPAVIGASSRSATLLDAPSPKAKTTWWGLIPIGLALGGAWLAPPLIANSSQATYFGPGLLIGLGAVGLATLGVAMIVHSEVVADASNGTAPRMEWWGLIPLGLGLVATSFGLALAPSVFGVQALSMVMTGFGMAGLSLGAGMLIGRATGVAAATSPKLSFFVLPEGGAGLTVVGRLP